MEEKTLWQRIKPVLSYVGFIGATLSSLAYLIIVFVLIKGFQYQQTTQTVVFAGVNAVVGLVICNFLRLQGQSFGQMENKQLIDEYYSTKTKDKKPHSMKFFWVKSIITDLFTKALTIIILTTGLIYIVIVGSNDYSKLWLAITNLIMFICFGLVAMAKAYDYYSNVYTQYMKEQIKNREVKDGKD